MGSGKSGNVFDWAINPLNIIGKGEWDPLATMTSQSWKNTWNVATGKENFAAHDNWFGHGFVGDFLNPVLGGRSDDQRADAARVDKLWQNYYSDRFGGPSGVTSATKGVEGNAATAERKRKKPGKNKVKMTQGVSLLDEDM